MHDALQLGALEGVEVRAEIDELVGDDPGKAEREEEQQAIEPAGDIGSQEGEHD
ncbi:hypothetical protein D3C83_229560 [compost metagenome]